MNLPLYDKTDFATYDHSEAKFWNSSSKRMKIQLIPSRLTKQAVRDFDLFVIFPVIALLHKIYRVFQNG